MDFSSTISGAQDRLSVNSDGENASHSKLLELVKKLKLEGSEVISNYRGEMEKADRIYRAFRTPDKADLKAVERGEPMKIVYPVSYAQCQATISALMSMFSRTPFFELEGRNPDSYRGAKLFELELQYQLDQGNFILALYQWLLDTMKYGFGKININYEIKENYIQDNRMISKIMHSILGTPADRKVVSYEGNVFEVEDPYNIIFDSSVSIGEIQKGRYVFTQKTITRNYLQTLADQGLYFNIENIPQMTVRSGQTSGRLSDKYNHRNPQAMGYGLGTTAIKGGDDIFIDVAHIKLIPSDYGLSNLNREQIWTVAMANEARIIQVEPYRYEHGLFPTAILEYSPDIHESINPGMVQTINDLQELINWLLNSHIASVRKVIDNRIIVDPSGVNIDDIINKRNYIRTMPGKAAFGIDKLFHQVPITDVTQSHVNDAMGAMQMLQRVTGIGDNYQGIQLPTTRSANEVVSLNKQAGARVKLLAQLMFAQGFRPLGIQMIANTQQFMTQPRFQKVVGGLAMQLGANPMNMLQISPEDLQGMYSISMSDVTTPSDKSMIADTLKELLELALKVPQAGMMLGIDMPYLVHQILSMKGINNPTDYVRAMSPEQQAVTQMLTMQQQGDQQQGGLPQQPGPVQASVMPDNQVNGLVEKGNLVPMGTL